MRVPARQHRPRDEDHAARPVHDGPAGERRFLQATTTSSRWTTPRRSTRRLTRPQGGRRRRRSSSTSRGCGHDPDGARRYRAWRRSTARSQGIAGADRRASLLRLRGIVGAQQAAPAIRSCRSSPTAPAAADLDRGGAAAARSRRARRAAAKTDHARRARPRRRARRDRRAGRRAASARRSSTSPAERLVPAPDCGMKYLPRDGPSPSSRRWAPAPRSCAPSCDPRR